MSSATLSAVRPSYGCARSRGAGAHQLNATQPLMIAAQQTNQVSDGDGGVAALGERSDLEVGGDGDPGVVRRRHERRPHRVEWGAVLVALARGEVARDDRPLRRGGRPGPWARPAGEAASPRAGAGPFTLHSPGRYSPPRPSAAASCGAAGCGGPCCCTARPAGRSPPRCRPGARGRPSRRRPPCPAGPRAAAARRGRLAAASAESPHGQVGRARAFCQWAMRL